LAIEIIILSRTDVIMAAITQKQMFGMVHKSMARGKKTKEKG